MGCASSLLSRTRIKSEQEPFSKKKEGEENEVQTSRKPSQKHHSGDITLQDEEQPNQPITNTSEEKPQSGQQNQFSHSYTPWQPHDQKGHIHEQEPPSQPLNAWKQSGREIRNKNELVPPNPSRASTWHSSGLENQNQPYQLQEQMLPNQPHTLQISEQKDRSQLEQIFEKGPQRQLHEWKSKEQEHQNPPGEMHEQGPTTRPYACQPSAPEIQNQSEHIHKQAPHTYQSNAQENQEEPEHVHEQDSPMPADKSSELEQGALAQSQKWRSSEQRNQNRAERALEQLSTNPPNTWQGSELENQMENVQEQKPPSQQHALQSTEQGSPHQTEQALEQLPSQVPNIWQESEPQGHLKQVNKHKSLTQPNKWPSRELEKQNEPQQRLEQGALTQPHTRQSRDILELESQSEPEPANQTEPPRQKGISFPEHWTPMPYPDKTVHMVTLLPDSLEYQMVINQIHCHQGKLSIQKIERVQNTKLYQSFMLRKQKMDHDNGGNGNERCLFHGADSRSMPAIKERGFNRESCSVQKKAYGRGLYFTKDAFYSVGYAGSSGGDAIRYLYLARVLVGQYCQGNASMILPPPKQPSIPETLYDSVVDNTADPSIFVVFYGTQCYPEYLVTLERIDS